VVMSKVAPCHGQVTTVPSTAPSESGPPLVIEVSRATGGSAPALARDYFAPTDGAKRTEFATAYRGADECGPMRIAARRSMQASPEASRSSGEIRVERGRERRMDRSR
jgi:hypothetical protein